jgi:Tol biopolymer transport system component
VASKDRRRRRHDVQVRRPTEPAVVRSSRADTAWMRLRGRLGAAMACTLFAALASTVAGCGEMPASACRDYDGTMALSPDGHTLAVAVPDPNWLHVFLVDLRSGAVKRLTQSNCDAYPAWSPSGTSVALIHQGYRLTLIDRSGRHRRHVRGSDLATNSVQWAANGTLIYGIEDVNGFGGDLSFYIGSIPARGGKERHPIHHARYPALSPSGDEVAYVTESTNYLYVSRYPDGTPRLVLHHEGMSSLAWSPDGRWIAFHTPKGISIVTAGGRDLRLVVDSSAADTPIWLPDSRHLLYSTHDSDQIYETDLQHAETRVILDRSTLPAKAR